MIYHMDMEYLPVGKIFEIDIEVMPNNVFDFFSDVLLFAENIECRYERAIDLLAVPFCSRRLYEELTFKVWKLGAWSTTRINALEKMNEEQYKYWMEN